MYLILSDVSYFYSNFIKCLSDRMRIDLTCLLKILNFKKIKFKFLNLQDLYLILSMSNL